MTSTDLLCGVSILQILAGPHEEERKKGLIASLGYSHDALPLPPLPCMQARVLSFLSSIPEDLSILQSPITYLEHFRLALEVKGKNRRRRRRRREEGGGKINDKEGDIQKDDDENDEVDDESTQRQRDQLASSSDAHLFYSLHLLATLEGVTKLHDLTKLIDLFKRSVLSSDDKLRPWQAVMSTKNVYPIGRENLYILPAQVLQCDRNSALGLLLRRIIVASDAFLFDGWTRLWEELTVVTRPIIRKYIEELMLCRKTGVKFSSLRLNHPESPSSSPSLHHLHSPQSLMKQWPSNPNALRAAFVRSVEMGDLPTAQDALMSYFDHGFGQSVAGTSATTGMTTAIGVSSGDPSGGDGAGAFSALVGPFARVKELLISAYSAAPVGGAALGRSLMQYPLLAHAAMHARFGHVEEAVDALHECMRVAQASGDAACASYVLQQLVEFTSPSSLRQRMTPTLFTREGVNNQFPPSSSSSSSSSTTTAAVTTTATQPVVLTAEGVDLLRRVRLRASDLGLWRQQATSSLLLIEHAVISEIRMCEGIAIKRRKQRERRAALEKECDNEEEEEEEDDNDDDMEQHSEKEEGTSSSTRIQSFPPPPLRVPIPDWFSVDPYTSFRPGGYMVGATSASAAGSSSSSSSSSSTSISAAPISPAITTSSRDRDGIGNTAVIALMSSTASAASAALRRSRAIGERSSSSTSGVGAVAVDAAGRDAAAAVRQTSSEATAAEIAASALGPAALWSHPLPLSWKEALELQKEGHASRARMWGAIANEIHPHAGGYLQKISLRCMEEAERNLREYDDDDDDEEDDYD